MPNIWFVTYLQRCTSPVNILILIRFYIILHANEKPVLFGATYYCQSHMLKIQWNQYCLLTCRLCTIMLKFVHVLFLFTLLTKLEALPPVPHLVTCCSWGLPCRRRGSATVWSQLRRRKQLASHLRMHILTITE